MPENEKSESETPLVDALIDKAAKEMAREEWPGLRDTKLKEGDVQAVKEMLEKAKEENS